MIGIPYCILAKWEYDNRNLAYAGWHRGEIQMQFRGFAAVAQAAFIKTPFIDPRKRKPSIDEDTTHDHDDSRGQASDRNVAALDEFH